MPIDLAAAGQPGLIGGIRRPALRYDSIVLVFFGIFVFCGAIAFIEPSPYDFASLPAIGLWFLGGFRLHRFILPYLALIFLYNLGGFIALVPYLDEPDPTLFMEQSLYLAVTVVFFALFFAEDTVRRSAVCLDAFAVSCVVAAACGVIGYFDIGGLGETFTLYGRASGTFKDPNVLGSYLIMGALALIQTLILGRSRWLALSLPAIALIVSGILLSFSRGSWGAFVIATLTSIALLYATTDDRALRRRIVIMTVLAVAAVLVAVAVLLSIESIREIFIQRAAVTQDYDTGETGRFGNQLRSLPMLLDRINGFGPLRFRLTFGLEPHSSYINAFAAYGWLGGCAFFLIVGLTTFVGFRVSIKPSPYRRYAQVFWPSLMVFLIQGFQIDIDHWRHVYLMMGAVWGLETARIRWLERGAPA